MKAYVYYLHVDISCGDILLDKIDELGYKAQHVARGGTFQVYKVEMLSEDLMLLKLCIPSLEIDVDLPKDTNAE